MENSIKRVRIELKQKFRKAIGRRSRNKSAISEVVATIGLIAASIALGAVAYVWAASASVNSQNNLGQAAHLDIQAISERFVILATNFNYGGGTASSVTIWFYNSGIYNTTISSVIVNSTITCSINLVLPSGTLKSYLMSLASCSPASGSFSKNDLQTFKAVGQYGFYANYQVVS